MVAYLSKSDASEGFNQIIDFLNESSIKYALTVNPNIYVSCIKQLWTTVAVKKVNDVMRLQVLVDKKKVVVTEATLSDALRLDDAEGVECLPNEKIFAELARMGYEKPSTKHTFYKAFFPASGSIGYSGVETPLFEGMIVAQQVDGGDADVNVDNVSIAGLVAEGDDSVANHEVPTADAEPSIPFPTPPTQPPQQSHDIPLLTLSFPSQQDHRRNKEEDEIKMRKNLRKRNKLKTKTLLKLERRKIHTLPIMREANPFT
nr:hypothetical protein [Tanacetum cinerariifolium]